MKIRKFAAVLLALAAMTSCAESREDSGSAPETTQPVTETPTEASTEDTEPETEPVTDAPTEAPTEAPEQLSFGDDTWMELYREVLANRSYEPAMQKEGAYTLLAQINDDDIPELIVYSEDGSSFAAFTCVDGDSTKAILFDRGESYYFNEPYHFIPKGYAIGCMHPNNMGFPKFYIDHYTKNAEHYHDKGITHSGLCIDDRKVEQANYYDASQAGDLDMWSEFGVTFGGEYGDELIISTDWEALSASHPKAAKITTPDETAVAVYSKYNS